MLVWCGYPVAEAFPGFCVLSLNWLIELLGYRRLRVLAPSAHRQRWSIHKTLCTFLAAMSPYASAMNSRSQEQSRGGQR